MNPNCWRSPTASPPTPDDGHFFTLRNRPNWAARTAHDVKLLTDRIGTTGRVCDVGGGYGLFAIACAKQGLQATLVDDFYDMERLGTLDGTLALMEEFGVEVQRRNIIGDGLGVDPGTYDGVACFHVLEHLPLSPKPLFTEMAQSLRSGGVFVLAGPNAVNLRKRISVPLGTAQWSTMKDWYESERFRGHVREPTVQDFKYIARDLDLENPSITGMNFLGYASTKPGRRRLTMVIDRAIQRYPGLCSDLYLVGSKR